MAQDNSYEFVIVESYYPTDLSGRRGKIHFRPVAGEKYPQTMSVECARRLGKDYPVGTKFRLLAKLTDRDGSGEYLYSYHGWEYEVLR